MYKMTRICLLIGILGVTFVKPVSGIRLTFSKQIVVKQPGTTLLTCEVDENDVGQIFAMQIMILTGSTMAQFGRVDVNGLTSTVPTSMADRMIVEGSIDKVTPSTSHLTLTIDTEKVQCSDGTVYECRITYLTNSPINPVSKQRSHNGTLVVFGDARPVRIPPRKVPLAQQLVIEQEMAELAIYISSDEEGDFFSTETFPQYGMCCPVPNCPTLDFYTHPCDLRRHFNCLHKRLSLLYTCSECREAFQVRRGAVRHVSRHINAYIVNRRIPNLQFIDPLGVKPPLANYVRPPQNPEQSRKALRDGIREKLLLLKIVKESRAKYEKQLYDAYLEIDNSAIGNAYKYK